MDVCMRCVCVLVCMHEGVWCVCVYMCVYMCVCGCVCVSVYALGCMGVCV